MHVDLVQPGRQDADPGWQVPSFRCYPISCPLRHMDLDSPPIRSVLIALEGPMRSQTIELDAGELTVGREVGNSLQLDDRAASRRHCVVRSVQGQVHIADLDSRNGTYVNGLPVRERQLQHNDQIRVGDSVFLFQHMISPGGHSSVELDDSATSNTSTQWKSGGSVYFDEAQLNSSLPSANRTVRGLQVLLRISQAVQGAQSLESLEQHLLDALLEAVPAAAGAILLGAGAGAVNASFAVHRRGHDQRPLHIPSDIAAQVLSGRGGILWTREAETNAAPLSLLAVPLLCRDQIEGLLYLEAGEGAVLDNGHLDLAAAVGVIAGLAIYNLLRWETLRSENERLQASAEAGHDMIGSSPAMAKIYRFIARAAPTDSTVLIGGESGTGKELVARALHRNSPRREKAFVAINCAALTESLLEDELFGHERGAFTGAVALKKGKFEVADGGTLFLDEVGELAPGLQAKLLRVLQQREFERVGGTRPIQVDVRIIAATNRDLELAVKENAFRQDLFFRLNVISVVLPPLRERRGYYAARVPFCA